MTELNLRQQQQQLSDHLRNPEKNAAPVYIEARRMAIYSELFFNNIETFISSAFPIFCSLFTPLQWQALVRDFFSQHQSQSPYFLEISEEFLAYLNNDDLDVHRRFPFAKELCHYEWLELALDVAVDDGMTDRNAINAEGDLYTQSIVLSPFIWAQAYAWPVHEIGPENIPDTMLEQPSCLLVYRRQDFTIKFMQINPASIRLLDLIEEHAGQTGEAVIRLLASALSQPFSADFSRFALETLEKFRRLGIVLGTSSL